MDEWLEPRPCLRTKSVALSNLDAEAVFRLHSGVTISLPARCDALFPELTSLERWPLFACRKGA